MVRVKPDRIRKCKCKKQREYWVVDPSFIRPYRILLQEVDYDDI